jgi:hydroxyethylthiazole kinase-like uncharacterized protein yjeF
MAAVDAAATEPLDVLIDRAGTAVAWVARQLLGGTYGKRVVVVAGKGNNGADGRVAASKLQGWGAHVTVVDAPSVGLLPPADLVIDAAYGTGLSRSYEPPPASGAVLAVDIPSGVDGLTGELLGRPWAATETVTFGAYKPGLLFEPGRGLAGTVRVVDLGLDTSAARAHLIEQRDVASWVPQRAPTAHKWQHACWVVAGSPSMNGAAVLAAAAASRGGAGYVRLSSPGVAPAGASEVVHRELPSTGWATHLDDAGRFGCVVMGPGLGRGDEVSKEVTAALEAIDVPVVLDADGLAALGGDLASVRNRSSLTILTPHDGEYGLLTGQRPGPDRIAAARDLATAADAVVLLKGPATVVAEPSGDVLVSVTGDQRLATAGTGDVLAGLIGALVALGCSGLEAAACAAWLHGKAAMAAPRHGMVASDLLKTLPEVIDATHMG